jgi:HEXXH motif-containing protein
MRVGVDLIYHLLPGDRCVVGAAVFNAGEVENRRQNGRKTVGGDVVAFPFEHCRGRQPLDAVFHAPMILEHGMVGTHRLADPEGAEFGPDPRGERGCAILDAEQAAERLAGFLQCRNGRIQGLAVFEQRGQRVAVIALVTQENRKAGGGISVLDPPDVEGVLAGLVQAAQHGVTGEDAGGIVQAAAAGVSQGPEQIGCQHAFPIGQPLDIGENIRGAMHGLGDEGGFVGHGPDHRQRRAELLVAKGIDGVEVMADGKKDDHAAGVIAGPGAGKPESREAGREAAEMDFGFSPDVERARLLDAKVRCRLADSLDAAYAALDPQALPVAALGSLSQAIRSHPVRPGVMALYGDLMPAILDQAEAEVDDIIAELARPGWRAPAAHRIVTLDDAELGAGIAERYRRHIQDDPENLVSLNALEQRQLQEGRRRVGEALTLLAAAAPALRAETGALISEIVLVESQAAPSELAFHGASSFFIWGALVLNLAEHGSRVKLVEGIVHEAGHCLLHGFASGGTLTLNTTAELHVSPLREDKRPMEGLVHAAYVLARMHLAMDALLQPSLLAGGHVTAGEQAEARRRVDAAAQNFRAANETILSHAEFTPIGRAVFMQAQNYMRMHQKEAAV